MTVPQLLHEFVTTVPDDLEGGVLYVSMPYATAIHLCACGCGNQVVTPLSPSGWQLVFDGVSVTLHPSIGNWRLPCRSHYWIRRNNVRWADAAATPERQEPTGSLVTRFVKQVAARLRRLWS